MIAGRFELEVEGHLAAAYYERKGNVITFTHTEVPAALRGRGIGSQMMHDVLRSVRAQGFKIVPRCPFVANFIDRHSQYADLLA